MSRNVFEIPVESDTLVFKLQKKDGTSTGEIEATICQLHRLAMEAQAAAYTESEENDDWTPWYAKVLTKKFGFEVTQVSAHYISEEVFNRFHEEKKSLLG